MTAAPPSVFSFRPIESPVYTPVPVPTSPRARASHHVSSASSDPPRPVFAYHGHPLVLSCRSRGPDARQFFLLLAPPLYSLDRIADEEMLTAQTERRRKDHEKEQKEAGKEVEYEPDREESEDRKKHRQHRIEPDDDRKDRDRERERPRRRRHEGEEEEHRSRGEYHASGRHHRSHRDRDRERDVLYAEK